ncbi:N-methyl-L-tryptophan oxidase [Vibrio sp. ABG19]|uniref:N-methyl-L-tryptophan oxidase n=1 Tax=Vibrio sp. ABG19 TaxID=2817385 RepID=UPI00249D99C7|nr:N-methyl-L-tryptophan oxidase [Vibrio sp. ABG19]WGY45677.1 N-methyl-L-tryptophan oxidase [Vibrio sp. ABG19]
MKYDVVVVGAGSMGMAAGYFLARQGKKVLLMDAFDPPHHHASHHGETRIIRYAYGEGKEYVPLALRAKALWEELELHSGQSLFLQTGVLNMGEESSRFIQTLIASAEKYQLPLEILNAEQVHARFPGITLPENYIGCFESTSGVLRCEDCIAAYRDLALAHGAELLAYHPLQDIKADDQGVTLYSEDKIIRADKVIISAGAWATKLMSKLDFALPMQPNRKTFAWFEADEEIYGQTVFPAFSFDSPQGIYYGFPSIDGAGLKMGRHDGGERQDPDQEIAEYDTLTDSVDLERFLATVMPQTQGLMYGKTCMYSMTADEHFIIDTHPQHDNVIIAAGFSGHGFKFASVIGEILSDLAAKGATEHDLSLFSLQRFR